MQRTSGLLGASLAHCGIPSSRLSRPLVVRMRCFGSYLALPAPPVGTCLSSTGLYLLDVSTIRLLLVPPRSPGRASRIAPARVGCCSPAPNDPLATITVPSLLLCPQSPLPHVWRMAAVTAVTSKGSLLEGLSCCLEP